MRDQAIQALSQILNDNMGNRITPALATGVVALLNHTMQQSSNEQSKTADSETAA